MNNPVLSVIVPVFNAEKYLADCLVSILEQKIEGIQIIVVNDGSTDGSQKIIDAYANKNPCIIYVETENLGVSSARNTALSMATGEFIAFCDSDDIVPPKAYERMLKSTKEGSVDMVVGAFENIHVYPEKKVYSRQYRKGKGKIETCFFSPCLWNKIISNSVIKRNNIQFSDLMVGEDVVFIAELYPHLTCVEYIPKFVYQYHYYELSEYISLNHRYNYEIFQQHLYCRRKLHEILSKEDSVLSDKLVYESMTPFLLNYFFKTYAHEERSKIFLDLQEFLIDYKEHFQEELFRSIFYVSKEFFFSCTPWDYVQVVQFSPKDMVAEQYRYGGIGFRYIIIFLKNWIQYKINKKRKE